MTGWQWHELNRMQNHLHLTADRKPCLHLVTQFFLLVDALPDAQTTVSIVKTLKTNFYIQIP